MSSRFRDGAVSPDLDVVVFGAGFTGARVCRAATERGLKALGVVRRQSSAEAIGDGGFEVSTAPAVEVAKHRVGATTHAIVAFPPDRDTDVALAPLLARARAISYLSTTGVYEDLEGLIDDSTTLPRNPTPKYAGVLATEALYREYGAAVLRSPGIYGPGRGIHLRLLRGEFKLSGDGSGYGSRIHVEDLAELLLASAQAPGQTFVVGDLEPARQRDVVAWLCQRYGLDFPDSAALSEVHETLRRNRQVDASRALSVLRVSLKFPNFRVGFELPQTP